MDNFGFSITNDSFQNCKSLLQKYKIYILGAELVSVHGKDMSHHSESQYLVFRHVFLILSAFHSLFRMYPTKTMTYCNIYAILQIIRPEEIVNKEVDTIKFCIKADKEAVTVIYKEVVIQTPGVEDVCSNEGPLLFPRGYNNEIAKTN